MHMIADDLIRMTSIVESSPQFMIYLGADGKIEYMNPAVMPTPASPLCRTAANAENEKNLTSPSFRVMGISKFMEAPLPLKYSLEEH